MTARTIYFDNSATTRVSEAAAQAALSAMREQYGNPSSAHAAGVAAHKLLAESREKLAACLRVQPGELIFCSCGSEANNQALLGTAEVKQRQGKRVLVSAIEHPSLLEPAKHLAGKGYDVQHIPVLPDGQIDLAALAELLTLQTIFVGVHQVNNELGVIQPLREIGALIRKQAPQAFYHIDGVQALGKLPVELAVWQADGFAASGHKIHAPKGIGLLWLRKGQRLPALIQGGGQESGLRSGTENLPGIVAFAVAAEQACAQRQDHLDNMRAVKRLLVEGLTQIEGAALNGPASEAGVPYILNISFPGARSEVLLHYLEERGVYVSAGSACSSHKTSSSHVLAALGLPEARQDSALRFSLCAENTTEEAEAVVQAVRESVAEIRALMGGKSKGGRGR